MFESEFLLEEEALAVRTEADSCPEEELGSSNFFLGGILGWMLGSYRKPSIQLIRASSKVEGDYSVEEKDFLTELWRFEKELKSSMEREDWYRVYLLVHLAAEAIKNDWSEFIPGNPGYAGSSKFEGEVRNILQHFLLLCQNAIKLDYQRLLHEKVKTTGKTAEVYLDFDTMELTIDGEILERKGGGEGE